MWPYLTPDKVLSRDSGNKNHRIAVDNQNQSSKIKIEAHSEVILCAKTSAVACIKHFFFFYLIDVHAQHFCSCTHIYTHTDSDIRETCTLSSIPLGKDFRQQFLFIRLPAIWNQISPEDTMKLQIFSLPVHLPAKAHRINITTLSLSSCYKLARWWHFDQACVSPKSLTLSHTCTLFVTHTHTQSHTYTQAYTVRSFSFLCLPLASLLVTGLAVQWSMVLAACLSRLSALCCATPLFSVVSGLFDW